MPGPIEPGGTKTHDQKDSNIWVKGGVLVIEAREQKATGRRREYAYTFGRIKTHRLQTPQKMALSFCKTRG